MTDDLLTTADAARALGISRSRLLDIVAGGYRPRRVGRAWLWAAADLDALRPRIQGRPGAPRGARNPNSQACRATKEIARSSEISPPTP